jgi:hypothetical protein
MKQLVTTSLRAALAIVAVHRADAADVTTPTWRSSGGLSMQSGSSRT